MGSHDIAGARDVQVVDTNGLRRVTRRASLRELAGRAEVSYSLVVKVAAGQRRPNVALRTAVEELYGVPAETVFGDVTARPRRRPGG